MTKALQGLMNGKVNMCRVKTFHVATSTLTAGELFWMWWNFIYQPLFFWVERSSKPMLHVIWYFLFVLLFMSLIWIQLKWKTNTRLAQVSKKMLILSEKQISNWNGINLFNWNLIPRLMPIEIDCCCREMRKKKKNQFYVDCFRSSELLGGRYKRRFYILKIPATQKLEKCFNSSKSAHSWWNEKRPKT